MKAAVPISIFVGAALIGHEVRISRIEETRFRDSDGLRLEQRLEHWMDERFPDRKDFQGLVKAVQEIKESVKRLERKTP